MRAMTSDWSPAQTMRRSKTWVPAVVDTVTEPEPDATAVTCWPNRIVPPARRTSSASASVITE